MKVVHPKEAKLEFKRNWKSKFPAQEVIDLNVAIYEVKFWDKRVTVQIQGIEVTIWKDGHHFCFQSGENEFAVLSWIMRPYIDTPKRVLEELLELFVQRFKKSA